MPRMQVTLEFDFDEKRYIFRKDEHASQSKKNVIIKDAVASQVQIAMRSQGYQADVLTIRKKQS